MASTVKLPELYRALGFDLPRHLVRSSRFRKGNTGLGGILPVPNLVNNLEEVNCPGSTESLAPKIPRSVRQAVSQRSLYSFAGLWHTPEIASIPGTRGSQARVQVVRHLSLPLPGQVQRPPASTPVLLAHPQGRQPHQLFPAAGAPIGWRPAAPNINDTREPGLEAQARGQTPTTTAPATCTEQFSILS